MRVEYLWIALVALFWGGYPLVARASGYDGTRGALILTLAGLVPVALAATWGEQRPWPETAALVKLVIAGLLMGGGIIAFYYLTISPMEASVSIPIVDVAMLLVSTMLGIAAFGEALTLQKVVGILLLVAGIGMLRPT